MASRKLEDLVPELREKAATLLTACRNRSVELRPTATVRDPFEQARLWRQSRAREQIERKIREFEQQGAAFLAHCLRSVGPQSGPDVTGAPPGFSWHQWGEALDVFWVVSGEAEWSTTRFVNGVNGYQFYADEAVRFGLDAGGHWATRKDWPHVQLRSASSPAALFSLREIDDAMQTRFA